MKNPDFNPKSFWEEKIFTWEENRYKEKVSSASTFECLASRLSGSLRFRRQFALQYLVPHVEGQRIVELGCGSGFLAEELIKHGAVSYFGFDIAQNAIDVANRRTKAANLGSQINFKCVSVDSLPSMEVDVVFSLGLLDWLTDVQLNTLFAHFHSTHYLHSIAEKRLSLQQLIHKFYVNITYGYRTGNYVPRYYDVGFIKRIINPHSSKPIQVIRHPKLGFGAFLTTLPKYPEEANG